MKNTFKIAYLFSFSLVLALSSLYIFQIINHTKETYFIQNHQKEIGSLSKEAKVLFYGSSSTLPLSEVERIAMEMDFMEADEIIYIEVLGNNVVAR